MEVIIKINMKIYYITIDKKDIPVISVSDGIITIINPLILLLPGHIQVNSDDPDETMNLSDVFDIQRQLSKQTIEKYVTLRGDVFDNEFDPIL